MKQRLSWWEYEHLFENIDFTIIGSGIVGISTAIELKIASPNDKVLILDKKTLPIGASTKNAGFACFGSVSEVWDDYKLYGEKTCEKLIEMRWEGLSILKSRVSAKKMFYEEKPGAEVFISKRDSEFYKSKISWTNEVVAPIVKNDNCFSLNKGNYGEQIINPYEGSLNPQLMMYELELIARNLGVLFINGVDVSNIDRESQILETNYGEMSYQNLMICTNGFSRKLIPEVNIKPARNQVLITSKIDGFKLHNCYHMNKGYIYFKEYNGRLLLGGGRNLDEKGESTEELATTELIMSYLKGLMDEYILPGLNYNIEHAWSGILGVGDTKMPIVKKIDDHVVVAIRMGGMGVAVGSYIGKVAAGMIKSIGNRAYELYVR